MAKKENQEIIEKRCPDCGNVLKKKEVPKPPGFGISGTKTVLKCPNCEYVDRDPFRNISFFHSER